MSGAADAAVEGAIGPARHVCIRVPKPSEKERRRQYLSHGDDRGAWVRHCLGDDGHYVGRPKLDGGWHKADVVKRGSMFANPYPCPKFSLAESLQRFQAYMDSRLSTDCTTESLIALLPEPQGDLARRRFRDGGPERPDVGKSVAHLQLAVVGEPFRQSLLRLRGKRLGCFCDESEECHAKILSRLIERERSRSPLETSLAIDLDEPSSKRQRIDKT
eukprot:TRINITY_DN124301_c0_g1_i1.p1 TRINITY_DN124301_c0_g1~~TRINITY_DN124301_c0_g1_i1.p1  ORF type:complete len:254 (+),score=20.81 TRINITY_DN124301_c0_g1_i1:112-762(+)